MLREDYDLTREDIQLLSNRDALTAFFAKLGYDTSKYYRIGMAEKE